MHGSQAVVNTAQSGADGEGEPQAQPPRPPPEGVPPAKQSANVATAGTFSNLRVRLQLIRHVETCTTDIYLHNECAHV